MENDREGIAAMNAEVSKPTAELVKKACERFDEDNLIVEQALKELFKQYPNNTDPSHVLLKVVTLNRLYSTQIFAVLDVAQHIARLGQEIDASLTAGSPEIVDKIARVTVSSTGKQRINFSFATKYCSWHNPELYPIWDSRVDNYLWALQKQHQFANTEIFHSHPDLWDYGKFRDVMIAFRTAYGLSSFTFKDIDKFLWDQGGKRFAVDPAQNQTGSVS